MSGEQETIQVFLRAHTDFNFLDHSLTWRSQNHRTVWVWKGPPKTISSNSPATRWAILNLMHVTHMRIQDWSLYLLESASIFSWSWAPEELPAGLTGSYTYSSLVQLRNSPLGFLLKERGMKWVRCNPLKITQTTISRCLKRWSSIYQIIKLDQKHERK